MNKLVLAVLTLGAALTVPAPAHAATPGPGPLCGTLGMTDPGTEGGEVITGYLGGGPIKVTDDTGAAVSATLRCTIQVGGSSHADVDNGASASASGTGVVYLPPTLVSYNAPEDVPAYLCSQVTYTGGATLYWAPAAVVSPLPSASMNPGLGGHWTTAPDEHCSQLARAVSGDAEVPFNQEMAWTPCLDGIDNDGDGQGDYPADSGCSSALDSTEQPEACPDAGGAAVCVSLTPRGVRDSFDVDAPTSTSVDVAGYVDLYEFTTVGSVNVPCAVLGVDDTVVNPCATAGGRFVQRIATLVDSSVPAAAGALDAPLATVRICDADLVLTVNNIGVSSFPALTLC
jgi:hypothetical protein